MYQIYVKLLDGRHKALNFPFPTIPVLSVKTQIREITGVPIDEQRLLTGTKQLDDSSSLFLHHSYGNGPHPSLHLLLRLRGGKGGFGSLLRGAATKAGQKKTNNFDACRDMSGRRLRHVNAEKKLEEWKAEAEERRLEKVADDFIKKKAKVAGRKGGAAGAAEKYVEKYREDSAKCMQVVEKSVREAIWSSKRKVAAGGVSGSNAKKIKIWMGKRAVGRSDSDDTDEDDSDHYEEEENDRSVILDDENHLGRSKEAEGSSGSVTARKLDGEPSESGSENEDSAIRSSFVGESSDAGLAGSESNVGREPTLDTHGDMIVDASFSDEGAVFGTELSKSEKQDFIGPESGNLEDQSSDAGLAGSESNVVREPTLDTHGDMIVDASFSEEAAVFGTEPSKSEKQEFIGPESGNLEGTVGQPLDISRAGDAGNLDCGTIDAEASLGSESKQAVNKETVVMSIDVSDLLKPLNCDEFNSAEELEALGMARLKSELQSRGLKCGGTLHERAARLFLLKTTPLEMLPKKLLAKK